MRPLVRHSGACRRIQHLFGGRATSACDVQHQDQRERAGASGVFHIPATYQIIGILQGAPYGYTPFCETNRAMDGFRFWRQGFWRDHLQGRPYHISALYVVDLARFRCARPALGPHAKSGAGCFGRHSWGAHYVRGVDTVMLHARQRARRSARAASRAPRVRVAAYS